MNRRHPHLTALLGVLLALGWMWGLFVLLGSPTDPASPCWDIECER